MGSLTTSRRSLRNLAAFERSLGRFLPPFLLVCNSRHAGKICRLQRTCSIGGTKPRSFCESVKKPMPLPGTLTLYYIYGEGPGVFLDVLPAVYYSHFCKLVRAIRILFQRSILLDELTTAHGLLLQWVLDFKLLYCKREPNWLHFVCQCVHSLTHLARETCHLGPLSLSSQWTME